MYVTHCRNSNRPQKTPRPALNASLSSQSNTAAKIRSNQLGKRPAELQESQLALLLSYLYFQGCLWHVAFKGYSRLQASWGVFQNHPAVGR